MKWSVIDRTYIAVVCNIMSQSAKKSLYMQIIVNKNNSTCLVCLILYASGTTGYSGNRTVQTVAMHKAKSTSFNCCHVHLAGSGGLWLKFRMALKYKLI
jgi:hypothetical protein